MSQKDYKAEIVRTLVRKKTHIRELAKKLNINPMMIARKVKELLKENAVDFVQEGKNKSFFLKNTIEARTYMIMSEEYALLRTLEKYPQLRKIINKIQEDKRIKLAVLFGSYAKGMAKKESDIDIFIETDKLNLKKELSLVDSNLSIKIGKLNKDNNLVNEIKKNHVMIKGTELYYEKVGFFEKALQGKETAIS